ncbi:MAG: chromate transporter, partial [Candidatus Eremiobacteraeota bacterium]|nr:chromate transporter [Candidatus Eremiobacteraeota bacterium]
MPHVSLTTLFLRFLTIGAISFGGGIVAYLRHMLVEQTKWMTEDEFLGSLEISQTMPGLNAVNMSVLVGSRLRGPLGSTVAALGMILPGAIFVLGIGIAALHAARHFPIAHAAVLGIAAGATGLIGATT